MQSDVLDVALDMRNQFDSQADVLQHIDDRSFVLQQILNISCTSLRASRLPQCLHQPQMSSIFIVSRKLSKFHPQRQSVCCIRMDLPGPESSLRTNFNSIALTTTLHIDFSIQYCLEFSKPTLQQLRFIQGLWQKTCKWLVIYW